ncbi:hypothetical protein LTR04_002782 [Oleoguttula sp. CCFEE 6159]|nr:hypothetical protein LTR04_002782 [Oleoguttula sp. CCFEE 6159]
MQLVPCSFVGRIPISISHCRRSISCMVVASGGLLGSQLILGVIALENPDYVPQRWHQFLIYIGYNIFAFLINAFLNSALPYFNKVAITWSISGFVIISITVLACARPNYSSGDFVFRSFINQTGWPDGIAWLLGLLQGGLGLTGFDSVAHLIEEIPNADIEGPKIMIYCVAIGTFTGFVSFRMTYAFARDRGLPASRFFAKVHPKLGLPLNALYLTTVLVIIFGCIFLGSTSAFFAIISASVVALGVSYAMPISINVLQGRRKLPPNRAFILPEWFAWPANLIGIAYVIVTTVLFLFPPALPVTGENMNYCVVAFLIVLVISTVQWFVDGRKHYTGPRVEEAVGEQVQAATKSSVAGAVMHENGTHKAGGLDVEP